MAERQYDVASRIMTPAEIKQARLELNLSRRVMAELLLLSPGRGHERVKRWEDGDEQISPQSSQCIRLWLAVHGLGPVPPVPFPIGSKPAAGPIEREAHERMHDVCDRLEAKAEARRQPDHWPPVDDMGEVIGDPIY